MKNLIVDRLNQTKKNICVFAKNCKIGDTFDYKTLYQNNRKL